MNREHISGTSGPYTAKPSALPPLVQQCRDLCTTEIAQLLTEMFASCDDLFFDLSSRAGTNAEQNIYFESMREVRLRKPDVIANFKREVEVLFAAAARPFDLARPEQGADNIELSLVDNDQLEQRVALSTMISRARVDFQELLYHLRCRLDYLLPQSITERNNPLDPAQLANAFAIACAPLELDIKARIVLFKQFERLVINRLGKVYQSVNQHLANAGVLAKIRPPAASKQSKPSKAVDNTTNTLPTEEAAGGAAAAGPAITITFGDLSQLLQAFRQNNTSLPIAAVIPPSSFSGPAFAPGELEGLLAEAQFAPELAQGNQAQYADIRAALGYIAGKQQASNSTRSIGRVDEDVINLVSMFFDFVLQDEDVAVPVQALLARMQLPILRVALRDRSFFSNSQHPARSLINDIAACGVGWNEQDKAVQDVLFKQLSELVQRVHDGYDGSNAVFEQAVLDLQRVQEQERRKSSLVEMRTSEAAAGQAKAEHARLTVNRIIRERLSGRQVATTIAEFLNAEWQNVLFLTLLRHGEDSPEWLYSVQVMDDLLWSTLPHTDEKSRARLQDILPQLRERLLQGMTVAGVEQERIDSRLGLISDIHRQVLSGRAEEVVTQRYQPEQADIDGIGGQNWQDMTALERQQVQYRSLTYSFIKKAEALAIGTWMVFDDHRTGMRLRCKLAARIPESDTFVFVNRFGFKALEKSRKDVAYDLQTGRARPLDSAPLFDRTIQHLVRVLRTPSQEAHAPG